MTRTHVCVYLCMCCALSCVNSCVTERSVCCTGNDDMSSCNTVVVRSAGKPAANAMWLLARDAARATAWWRVARSADGDLSELRARSDLKPLVDAAFGTHIAPLRPGHRRRIRR